jgi:cell wall-associated NlpC family hydrolase
MARVDAALYVDECQNFLNLPRSFDEMLAEARGYGLSMVLAHQHLAQLPRELREAVSANARTKVFFSLSPEDAHALSRHVAPELSEHDLSHLGAFQAAARLVVAGEETPAFTLRTRPGRCGGGRADAVRTGHLRRLRHSACRPAAPTRPVPTTRQTPVYAAARDLCANGAENGADISAAIYAYNHSQAYVTQVLNLAESYGQTATQTLAASAAAQVAVAWALAQVGTPYVWGGETPGVGFDCSGLVQAAYRAAGISLPRVAQDQYDATTKLAPGDPIESGDLVFFGGGTTDITHVGIVVGNGQMVDAPYTGVDVRVESFAWSDLVGVTEV